MVEENSGFSDVEICNKIEYNTDNANRKQIQIKHSSFADIYTDEINLKDIEDPSSDKDTPNIEGVANN